MLRLYWVFAGVLIFAAPVHGDELQAGAAVIDITPPTGYAMWGYAARHDQPSVGVLDPLKARALVVTAGAERIVIVSLDLGRAPTRQSMATIRGKVKEDVGIEHLFVVGSHTHHGPVIEVDTWPTRETSYVRELEKKLAEVIIAAAKKLRKARIGVASRQVELNRNRHSRRPDKPVDRELLVLRVEDITGQPIAHAVNFAAHPTMHESKLMKISADYPGAMAALIEKETNAPCLFLQGASGDLSTNPGTQRGPENFGRALGTQALELAHTIRCDAKDDYDLRIREEDFRFFARIDLANPLIKKAIASAFYPDIVSAYEREYREGVRPHLTVALLNGRVGFVGVSGEVFCGHSLHLKKRARLDHLFFLGYCNDYQQYFPTIEAASEGGYGTEPQVSPVELGAGEHIMDRALLHLYQMQGKFAPTVQKK